MNVDESQEAHLDLVYAGSLLRAEVYGITPITSRAEVAKIASAIQVNSGCTMLVILVFSVREWFFSMTVMMN